MHLLYEKMMHLNLHVTILFCTFAMPLKFLLVLKCSTKVSEKSDMAKSWAIFCCPGT